MAKAKRLVIIACLVAALVAAATTDSAFARTLPTLPGDDGCEVPADEMTECALAVFKPEPNGTVFSQKCCDKVAKAGKCACKLRTLFKDKTGNDPQESFCPENTGCDAKGD